MQTAARLDFIGLPRLRGCGGSVFLCWKENWGAAVDCVGEVGVGARLDCGGGSWAWREAVDCGGRGWDWREAWIVSARLGLERGVDCVGEVGLGARLWFVRARLGLAIGRRRSFKSPLSARVCSPLSPKGKARGLKNKERPLQSAEADSFPRRGKQGA